MSEPVGMIYIVVQKHCEGHYWSELRNGIGGGSAKLDNFSFDCTSKEEARDFALARARTQYRGYPVEVVDLDT